PRPAHPAVCPSRCLLALACLCRHNRCTASAEAHRWIQAKNSLERMGFVYEGKLRSHQRRPDDSRRDSLYYSLLADEWPRVGPELLRMIGEKSKP
ncbi:MAG: GNAT family N-acetyltransferase, partial [Candidatus Dormibacteria bacterium]